MEILQNISLEFNKDKLLKKLFLEVGTAEADEFLTILNSASPIANPKAIYKQVDIESVKDDEIRISGVTFTSNELACNLREISKVYIFITTCGLELESIEINPDDFLTHYWLDVIKAESQKQMTEHLRLYLQEKLDIEQMSSMCPGTGAPELWSITDQKSLFSLLPEAEEAIGVTLSDECIMNPIKSLSGLFFKGEWHYKDCHNSPRTHCPEHET
jgi:hypothetical protein